MKSTNLQKKLQVILKLQRYSLRFSSIQTRPMSTFNLMMQQKYNSSRHVNPRVRIWQNNLSESTNVQYIRLVSRFIRTRKNPESQSRPPQTKTETHSSDQYIKTNRKKIDLQYVTQSITPSHLFPIKAMMSSTDKIVFFFVHSKPLQRKTSQITVTQTYTQTKTHIKIYMYKYLKLYEYTQKPFEV